MKKLILCLSALLVLPILVMGFACGGGGGGGGGGDAAAVLFVDDDNGFNNRADIGGSPDVDHIYIGDLDALGIEHDVSRVMGEMSNGPDLSTLQKYEVVIWATGESGNGHAATPATLTHTDQANIAEYLEGGGTLFLSGQEVLWDLCGGCESSGDVLSAFANTYLGVLDADDGGSTPTAAYGVSGDPVTDGLVLSGPDINDDGYLDAFPYANLGPETGSAIWGSSGAPQTLTMTASSTTDFASTVFSGAYDIDTLTDDTLSFGGHSFWAFTDGSVSLLDTWFESLGANHYATLNLGTPGSYIYNEKDGVDFEEYADSLNDTHSFPAHADTLLVDPGGLAIATRVEQSPWKVIFLALPYEGLTPGFARRGFLEDSISWLQQ